MQFRVETGRKPSSRLKHHDGDFRRAEKTESKTAVARSVVDIELCCPAGRKERRVEFLPCSRNWSAEERQSNLSAMSVSAEHEIKLCEKLLVRVRCDVRIMRKQQPVDRRPAVFQQLCGAFGRLNEIGLPPPKIVYACYQQCSALPADEFCGVDDPADTARQFAANTSEAFEIIMVAEHPDNTVRSFERIEQPGELRCQLPDFAPVGHPTKALRVDLGGEAVVDTEAGVLNIIPGERDEMWTLAVGEIDRFADVRGGGGGAEVEIRELRNAEPVKLPGQVGNLHGDSPEHEVPASPLFERVSVQRVLRMPGRGCAPPRTALD